MLGDVLDLFALPSAMEQVKDAEADQLERVAVGPFGLIVTAG